MPTIIDNSPKSNISRSRHIFSFVGVLLLVLLAASSFVAFAHSSRSTAAHAATSFGFTYTGDYDQTAKTTANLNYIGQQYTVGNINFNLGLGDFSYASTLTSTVANNWSTYATGILPPPFPFEIIDGRHDSSQIKTYETDLPNQIGNLSTSCATLTPCTYGEQYYFDYPVGAPLARIIMISPNQTIPGHTYNYNAGGADYKWVKNVIDAAHTAKIPWVIVGMHEYCFVIGTAKCTNQQLLDLLLNEHVDVILQAQKHNYQASKQLALNSTCTTLNATTYNANCIVNATQNMTQGKGSVIVVTGTGGASQLAINTSDPKAGYFRTYNGLGSNTTWGVSQFTISATQLSEQFVPVSPGGGFKDNFTISQGSPTPPPPPPTMPAQDTFARSSPPPPYWGTASDGINTWGADANTLSNFSINNNVGQVVGSGTNARGYTGVLGPTAANAEVQVSGSLSSYGGNTLGAVLRWTNGNNFYKAYLTGKALIITKKVNGTITQLKSVAFSATAGISYTLLFSASSSSLNASVWTTGTTPPGTWMVTATDSSLASGNCGILVFMASAITADFTAFLATSQ